MATTPSTFQRYLPLSAQAAGWGWHVIDAGRQAVLPGGVYPVSDHPLTHQFAGDGRRVLDEYQIIHLAAGEGYFESASLPMRKVRAGETLLVFSGEWHRYHPDPGTGWTEYWVGFNGSEAGRVMGSFFGRQTAVRQSAFADEILRLMDQLLHWIRQPAPGVEQILASMIPMILAFLLSDVPVDSGCENDSHAIVYRAKIEMLKHLSERTDLEALARSLGVSYSRFRSVFKEQTGFAPREYENLIKLNRSRDLLRSGRYSVTRTAEVLGYSSIYYFSRAFRKAFGQSPQAWLQHAK